MNKGLSYKELLVKYMPRPVRNSQDLARTFRKLDKLMRKPNLPPAESEIVELLSILIEQYESATYTIDKTRPLTKEEHAQWNRAKRKRRKP